MSRSTNKEMNPFVSIFFTTGPINKKTNNHTCSTWGGGWFARKTNSGGRDSSLRISLTPVWTEFIFVSVYWPGLTLKLTLKIVSRTDGTGEGEMAALGGFASFVSFALGSSFGCLAFNFDVVWTWGVTFVDCLRLHFSTQHDQMCKSKQINQ